jgi:hypothetical protein
MGRVELKRDEPFELSRDMLMDDAAVRIAREVPLTSELVLTILKQLDGDEKLTRQWIDLWLTIGASTVPYPEYVKTLLVNGSYGCVRHP